MSGRNRRIAVLTALFGSSTLFIATSPASAEKAAPAPVAPPKAADARAADPALGALERFGRSIQRVTLDNGMRIVLNPDRTSPTVSVAVTYGVGSRDERAGQSGFAHLFEHMMFQGSRHVKKGDHFTLIAERGGTLNGTTSTDRTNYFEVLPASELPLALWLEADRMRALNVTAENFENQRAVVQEEYRMRYENAPYARGMLRLGELIFEGYPPYAHSTIGSMKELEAAKFEWVKEFYERYYAPNNAVLAIAGDFDTDEAMRLVREYFGSIPTKPTARAELGTAPAVTQGKQETVDDPNVKTPGFFYGFRIPPSQTKEHYALELLAVILADGESSRLHQLLVRDRAVAQRASAWTRDNVGPDEFGISVVLTEKGKLKDVERMVDAELEKARKTPPSAAELAKAKNQIRASFVFGIQTNMGRAVKLSEYESYYGDARQLARELGHYLDVKAEDIQRAAAEYLTPQRRTLIEVLPVAKPLAASAAPPKGAKP
jgi:zinc protease